MKKPTHAQIKKFLKYLIPTLLIFIVATFFYIFLFNGRMPMLSGEDSYYHLGMAKFIVNHGVVQKFPYLFYTTLHQNFVDHHLLFHLLLIPFVKLFGDFVGAKLLIILSLAILYLFLYFIFQLNDLKLAFLYSLVLLFVMPSDFYFRMNFIRVEAPSLLFMILIFWSIKKMNFPALGILAFLFPWLYGGSVFLPIIIICHVLSSLLANEKVNYRILTMSAVGFLMGIIVNPYFPQNIYFLYDQIFKTGLNAKEYSGGEWRPYDTWYWLQMCLIPIIFFGGSLFLTIAKNIKVNAFKLTVLLFTFFILFLQWKSKRFIEYWPFFAGMSAFLLIGAYFEEWLKKREPTVKISVLLLLFIFCLPYSREQISKAQQDTATTPTINDTQDAMNFLKQNSNEGDIVFTDDWDIFPYYFYFNQKNYYIVGLDPEFMNQYDPGLYKEYAAISSGRDSYNLDKIKTEFKAKWVIVDEDHRIFNQNLRNDDLFESVYQNKTYTIYSVIQAK